MLTTDSQSPKATSRARHQFPENQNRLSALKKRLTWVKNRQWSKLHSYCQNSTTRNPESKSKFQKVTPRVRWIPRGR